MAISKTKSSDFGFGGDRRAAAPIASGFFRISTL
jgi:hypothetical protein